MPEIIEIVLEPLSPKAFAPFGQIVGESGTAPHFTGSHIAAWRMAFEAEGGAEILFARYVHQPIELSRMERHFNVTQAFLPLGDQPSVMVVAAPADLGDRAAKPKPQAVRAFYVEGSRGIMLWKGTWHALTRFPARPSGAEFAVITGAATQAELERETRDGARPKLTQVVDFATEYGAVLKVVDPHRLMAVG